MKTYNITIQLSMVEMDAKVSRTALAEEVLETVAAIAKRLGDKPTVAVSAPSVYVVDRDTLSGGE